MREKVHQLRKRVDFVQTVGVEDAIRVGWMECTEEECEDAAKIVSRERKEKNGIKNKRTQFSDMH